MEITPEKINNAITDKIPERPVGVVEGTSYSLIIAAAFAVSAGRTRAISMEDRKQCALIVMEMHASA